MSSFDFIVDEIRYSYSSVTTFETCPYSFKLTYIKRLPREDNFYSDYGTLIHDCLYNYFVNKMEAYELSGYFRENYEKVVKTCPPEYPRGAYEKYKDEGISFFNKFSFEIEDYDLILAEEKIDFDFDNKVLAVAKPDLVLFNKKTGKFILYDFKSSAPFRENKTNGKEIVDEKKLEGYWKQLYIYTYALRNYKFTPIDEMTLWFTRPERRVTIPWKEKKETESIRWMKRIIKRIKEEEKFNYNNSSSFFCDNLCGVRMFCEYR